MWTAIADGLGLPGDDRSPAALVDQLADAAHPAGPGQPRAAPRRGRGRARTAHGARPHGPRDLAASAAPVRRVRAPGASADAARGRRPGVAQLGEIRRGAAVRAAGPPRPPRLPRSTRTTPTTSRRSAGCSTGCRWPSSSPPRASSCSGPARCGPGSPATSNCWPPSRRSGRPGSRRCGTPSPGATGCCRPSSSGSSGSSASSPASSTSTRRPRSPATAVTPWTRSGSSSTSASSPSATGRTANRGSTCCARSPPSRAAGSRRPASSDDARRRHAEHYAAFVEEVAPRLRDRYLTTRDRLEARAGQHPRRPRVGFPRGPGRGRPLARADRGRPAAVRGAELVLVLVGLPLPGRGPPVAVAARSTRRPATRART